LFGGLGGNPADPEGNIFAVFGYLASPVSGFNHNVPFVCDFGNAAAVVFAVSSQYCGFDGFDNHSRSMPRSVATWFNAKLNSL
jgi:hypothetical protein